MTSDIHPHRRLIYSLGLIAIGLAISAGIICLVSADLGGNFLETITSNACESDYPELIEEAAQIKLPPSATRLQSSCRSSYDSAAAYFDMNPSDLAVFVKSTNVKMPLASTGKPAKLECSTCNKLTGVTSYLYGTYETHYDTDLWFEEIFIDTSNPAQYRVYFTVLAG